ETGSINLPNPTPNNTWFFQIRGDHQFSPKDNFTARYAYGKPVDVNIASNTQFGSRFAGNQTILDQNIALSETHLFSAALLNEFRYAVIRRNLQFPENDPKTPTTNVGPLFTIGGLANFPQGRIQTSFQFSDTLNWTRGRHALK